MTIKRINDIAPKFPRNAFSIEKALTLTERSRTARSLVALLASGLLTITVCGQGTLQFISTGNGVSLVSRDEVLPTTAASRAAAFDFGFATEESAVPGVFLDSFTVSFGGPNRTTMLLATIDASGVAWAPSGGSGGFSETQILRTSIPATGFPPISGRGVGFSVQFPLPIESLGSDVHLTFDLFDNLDGQMSSGWYDKLRIVTIPEPSCVLLLSVGFASILIFKSRRA